MMKGISQSQRNNAWHTKHTKKLAQAKQSHYFRSLVYHPGKVTMARAENMYKRAQEREATKKVNFWQRLQYAGLRTKINAKSKLRRLKDVFSPKEANA